jgi:HAMP domain-containing protein
MTATPSATPPAQDGIDIDQLHAFMKALRGGDLSFRFAVTRGMTPKAQEVALGLNRHLEQMAELLSEVSRVCADVGVTGHLGPQAELSFPSGAWQGVVHSVNVMAANLTDQIRDMNRTAKRIALGRPPRPATCDCQGETLELRNALNAIVDRLHRQQPEA